MKPLTGACLRQLDVEDFEDLKTGFSISLTFAENPFFKNRTLVKKVCFDAECGIIRTEFTPVEWAKPVRLPAGWRMNLILCLLRGSDDPM